MGRTVVNAKVAWARISSPPSPGLQGDVAVTFAKLLDLDE